MDVTTSYEGLEKFYTQYFALPSFGPDISDKLAFVGLICRLTDLLKKKKPDVTYWSVLYQLNQKGSCGVDDEALKGLAILCSDFGYGCSVFPNFGVADKDLPKKIMEFLKRWLPF